MSSQETRRLCSRRRKMMKGLNVRGVTEFCRSVVLKPQLLLPQVSVKGTLLRSLYMHVCVALLLLVYHWRTQVRAQRPMRRMTHADAWCVALRVLACIELQT